MVIKRGRGRPRKIKMAEEIEKIEEGIPETPPEEPTPEPSAETPKEEISATNPEPQQTIEAFPETSGTSNYYGGHNM